MVLLLAHQAVDGLTFGEDTCILIDTPVYDKVADFGVFCFTLNIELDFLGYSALQELELGFVTVWIVRHAVYFQIFIEMLKVLVFLILLKNDRAVVQSFFEESAEGGFSTSDVSRYSSTVT